MNKLRFLTGLVLIIAGAAVILFAAYWLWHTWHHGWIWFIGQGFYVIYVGYTVLTYGDVWKAVRYAIIITSLGALLMTRT